MTQALAFVVLSTGLESFRELRDALAADERTRLLAGGDDAEQLYAEITRLRPNAAIVTLPDVGADATLRYVERMSVECPQTVIICASRDASPDLILRSLRAGAREFLRLPLRADEFRTVIDRTSEVCAGQTEAPKKRGRAIAVFSSKGGCGTSFIATNIAAALDAPTVLVDLNLQAGDLALYLGVEPKFSIADLVEKRAHVDGSLLNSLVAPHTSNLALLAAPREADLADDIEAEHVFAVIEVLRQHYDYVVIDPQHTFDAITLAALDQVDEIVLVLTLDIPAIRSAQRTLQIFDRLGYPRHKVRIVVNRWSKQIELDVRQVERYLGEKVTGYVQSDYNTAVNSINLGQPLVESNPTSRIATELRQIAASINGAAQPVVEIEPRRGFLGGVFQRRKGAPAAFGLPDRLNKDKAPAAI
ncbi:MAG: CpaE family protein [Pyrinomonadaceae bacterium]